MPYIEKEKRLKFDWWVSGLVDAIINDKTFHPGQLNYSITMLLEGILKRTKLSYTNCNNLLGTLDCVAREFYRKRVAPYEDEKAEENGDVY